MKEDDIFKTIIAQLDEYAASARNYMESGGCNDYAVYREMVGRISSVELMKSYVKDLEEKFLEQ